MLIDDIDAEGSGKYRMGWRTPAGNVASMSVHAKTVNEVALGQPVAAVRKGEFRPVKETLYLTTQAVSGSGWVTKWNWQSAWKGKEWAKVCTQMEEAGTGGKGEWDDDWRFSFIVYRPETRFDSVAFNAQGKK